MDSSESKSTSSENYNNSVNDDAVTTNTKPEAGNPDTVDDTANLEANTNNTNSTQTDNVINGSGNLPETASANNTESIPNNVTAENTKDGIIELSSLNSKTIESYLNKVSCTVKKNSSEDDLRRSCFSYGICKLIDGKNEDEENNGRCIFDKIYCNNTNCFHDDGCGHSYIKHAKPQYLRDCEKNPQLIFESCPPKGDVDCTTRECTKNEQCLSGSCINRQCITNIDNPIRYCSNNEADEFSQTTDIFSCQLFMYERCSKDSNCLTRNCANIKGDLNNLYCIETKVTFANAMACVLTYAVVVITLVILHGIYKQTKKTKSH